MIYQLYLEASSREYDRERLIDSFRRAWECDSLLTVKLIMYIRDIRNGLGRRHVSYILMNELKDKYPDTYLRYLSTFCELYGSFRDLRELANNNGIIEISLFKVCLLDDLELLRRGECISLASKWAPTEGGKYDKLAKKLASELFPDSHDCMRRYRKEVLTPLRKHIDNFRYDATKNKASQTHFIETAEQLEEILKIYNL